MRAPNAYEPRWFTGCGPLVLAFIVLPVLAIVVGLIVGMML